jgi:hypothetical protein
MKERKTNNAQNSDSYSKINLINFEKGTFKAVSKEIWNVLNECVLYSGSCTVLLHKLRLTILVTSNWREIHKSGSAYDNQSTRSKGAHVCHLYMA